MVALDSQPSERPSAPRRIKQVLEAAETCFRRHGFHATSMAEMAVEANMSVGHIYRYFSGKDDIITAILERDVAATLASFEAADEREGGGSTDFLDRLREIAVRKAMPHCSVLSLEILAEAARNPKAADVVRQARHGVTQHLCTLLRTTRGEGLSEQDAAEMVDMLVRLVESIAFRVATSRECSADAEVALVMGYAEKLLGCMIGVKTAAA